MQVNANSSVASYSLGFLNAAASDSAGQAVPIAALSGSIAITRKVSATALVSSLNPEVAGQSVTFTATVSSTAGGTPTGTVTFFKGSTALGTGAVTLNGSGVATLSTSVLVVGSPSITASYSGDANYAASVSPAVTETVNAAGFAPPATGLTVTAGQNLPTNLTLYAAAGSGLNFTLSCLGAPAKTTCLFGSNPVAPGPPPNGTTVQMTLQTSSSELPPRPSNRAPRPWGTLGIFTALAAILAGTNHLRHAPRRRLAFGMCVAVFALASILISCGGGGAGSSPTLPYTGTPKGPVTFTVNGTSGTTTISTQVTVTVQ
ncbi:MAG: Ig-like domain repeat protein [Acidobacteriia bacterium]|nr:Ig-like domain repeat protein [Terriglobia bacterium]